MDDDIDSVMNLFIKNYTQLLHDGHPQVANYPLMSSPWPTWAIVSFYLICIYLILPQYMKNRDPYSLKMPIVIYNAILVSSNVYVFSQIGRLGWFKNYSLLCSPVDYTITDDSAKIANTIYFLYLLRFAELIETIFFILRKKYNQVNKLHVIHHFIVPPYGWYVAKYTPVGCGTFFPLLNTFVHIVMYSYYGLAAFGPQIQKYLWWKKYITKLQLLQFVIATIYYSYFLVNRSCNCPIALVVQSLALAIFFLAMFANFYIQTYNKVKTDQRPTSKLENGDGFFKNVQENGYSKNVQENGYSKLQSNGFNHSSVHHRTIIQNSSSS